ncbi:hypothetical protein IC232_03485 [Microvirga sp. BT688]|uniref:hypothetical protein n=1 Tax=Microvirga sp. TaxID=1873136 RepID=UPI0016873D7F|nr:hypothetical protein [Microvirga sp.]MBD2745752.1 hypothetical protein [Microvirga sp.]
MDTLAFKNESSNRSIIVGTRTGGQGKTLVSQVLHHLIRGTGASLRVMAADTAGEEGSATKSKLGRFLEGEDTVEELGIGVKINSIRSDATAALQYWDPLGRALEGGNVLVDVGANVLPSIWNWAVEIDAGRVFEEAPPIWLVIPVTAQAQSLVDAADLIRLAEKNRSYLPIAHYYVVFNEQEGKFATLEDTAEYQDLMSLLEAENTTKVKLERCKTSVWSKIQGNYISLTAMRKLGFREYGSRFGLSSFMASAAEKDFTGWLLATQDAFLEAKLIPAHGGKASASQGEVSVFA